MDDLTEIDGVIAAVVALADRALDVSDGLVQERNAVAAHVPCGILKLLDPLGGKAVGEVFLVFAQQVDGKHPGVLETIVAVGLLVDADQHQRRVEGEGRKGIGGDPGGDSRLVLGRDDGYSGGEMPHDMPDLSRVHGAPGNRQGGALSIAGRLISTKTIDGCRAANARLADSDYNCSPVSVLLETLFQLFFFSLLSRPLLPFPLLDPSHQFLGRTTDVRPSMLQQHLKGLSFLGNLVCQTSPP